MQENNFEKQVQQKMEELSFTPSAPVWQKVEAQIRKKKERRRVVLWLLPLLLLTGSVIWWQYGHLNNKETLGDAALRQAENKNAFKTPYNRNQKEADTLQASNGKSSLSPKMPGKAAVAIPEPEHTIAKKTIPKRSVNKVSPNDFDTPETALKQSNAKPKSGPPPAETKNSNDISKAEKQTLPALVKDSAAVVTTNALTEDATAKITIEDSASTTVDSLKINGKDSIALTAPPKKLDKEAKRWQREAYARIGISGTGNQLMDVLAREALSDFSASPAAGNGGNGFRASSGNTSSGISFSIGGGIKRKVSNSSFVAVGLQYSYYSMKRQVGTRVSADTAVLNNGNLFGLRMYFRGNFSTETYRTQFHYIELPVAFEYQLLKKQPLHLRHGISVGRLLGNNALYYHRQAGIYYQSDHWLRKTSINLSTIVDYRIIKSNRLALYAGPQLQWGLTPLQKEQEQRKQHLFFGGLHTRMAF